MAGSVSTKTTTKTRLDTSIFVAPSLDGTTPIVIGFDVQSTKLAGLMKSAAIFYKILLTDRGSNPLNPNEGTDFSGLLEANVGDDSVLYTCIQQGVDDALEQLQAYQVSAAVTTDEQVTAAQVSNFAFNQATRVVDFSVDLFAASGEEVTLEIPSIVIT